MRLNLQWKSRKRWSSLQGRGEFVGGGKLDTLRGIPQEMKHCFVTVMRRRRRRLKQRVIRLHRLSSSPASPADPASSPWRRMTSFMTPHHQPMSVASEPAAAATVTQAEYNPNYTSVELVNLELAAVEYNLADIPAQCIAITRYIASGQTLIFTYSRALFNRLFRRFQSVLTRSSADAAKPARRV